MILTNGTLVAVTDGTTLRCFRNKGHDPRIDLVEMPAPGLHPASTGSGGRHRTSAANPDHSRLREDDFAAAVAGYLNREGLAGTFDHLVVIADPRTLGELRKHFHAPLRAKLAGELAKDVAKRSAEEIEEMLIAA
jgi:protein required for attachment to host cells